MCIKKQGFCSFFFLCFTKQKRLLYNRTAHKPPFTQFALQTLFSVTKDLFSK